MLSKEKGKFWVIIFKKSSNKEMDFKALVIQYKWKSELIKTRHSRNF